MLIYAIIIFSIIGVILTFFGKINLPNSTIYEDDKNELKRLLHQEEMLKKIHEAEKKEK